MTSVGHSGEAGHWGKDVRSDMHVLFEARESGSIEISLESRVAPYYGAAIQEQTLAVLVELGVKHARVAIHDEGALPFTIGARIEAAVRRAGAGLASVGCPSSICYPRHLRRSDCAARASICRVRSRSTSSMPPCMAQMQSSSIWKIPFTGPRRMRRGFLCATRSALSISAHVSAWCASINCRWALKIWRKSSAKVRT